jgi:uncharacterized protein
VASGHVVIEEDRMTPDERKLIEDLFERMVNYGAPDKDREAEALIRERVRAMPDAVYMLTQSVLVQEQALEAANERAAELEDRLRALEESQGGPPRRSGSFLSGGFAGRRDPDPRPSSVPQVGARATPSPYDRPSAWGPPPPPPGQAPPPAGGGGGFMRSAMATAAGVAGGVLAAESIRNLLGGSHARAGESGSRDDKQALADQDRRQDLDQDRESDQADQDRKQDLEQDRELEQAGDQGDYDSAEDDGFDGDGDFGDDGLDV